MRISDWSSDVCSSDLRSAATKQSRAAPCNVNDSGPPLQHLVGRAMPVAPGADVGDDLVARCLAPLDRRRGEVGEEHRIVEREQFGIDLRLLRIDVDSRTGDPLALERGDQRLLDRKSTRLNSQSLIRISYAVFC